MDTRNICTVTSQAEKALKSSAWALVSALRSGKSVFLCMTWSRVAHWPLATAITTTILRTTPCKAATRGWTGVKLGRVVTIGLYFHYLMTGWTRLAVVMICGMVGM